VYKYYPIKVDRDHLGVVVLRDVRTRIATTEKISQIFQVCHSN